MFPECRRQKTNVRNRHLHVMRKPDTRCLLECQMAQGSALAWRSRRWLVCTSSMRLSQASNSASYPIKDARPLEANCALQGLASHQCVLVPEQARHLTSANSLESAESRARAEPQACGLAGFSVIRTRCRVGFQPVSTADHSHAALRSAANAPSQPGTFSSSKSANLQNPKLPSARSPSPPSHSPSRPC